MPLTRVGGEGEIKGVAMADLVNLQEGLNAKRAEDAKYLERMEHHPVLTGDHRRIGDFRVAITLNASISREWLREAFGQSKSSRSGIGTPSSEVLNSFGLPVTYSTQSSRIIRCTSSDLKPLPLGRLLRS